MGEENILSWRRSIEGKWAMIIDLYAPEAIILHSHRQRVNMYSEAKCDWFKLAELILIAKS